MTVIDGTRLIRRRPPIAVFAFMAALFAAHGLHGRASIALIDLEFFARLRLLALPAQMRGPS